MSHTTARSIGTPYKQFSDTGPFDAIVIGSGMGTAALLAKAGNQRYEHFAAWEGTRWHRRGEAYDAVKSRIAARMFAALSEHLPAVAGAVKTWELSAPLSTEHFANAPHGAIYGLAHTPARFECRELRPRTPIRGLYLTGQDSGTCGVMGALSGAVVTASVMLRRNLFSTVAKTGAHRHVGADWEQPRAA